MASVTHTDYTQKRSSLRRNPEWFNLFLQYVGASVFPTSFSRNTPVLERELHGFMQYATPLLRICPVISAEFLRFLSRKSLLSYRYACDLCLSSCIFCR